MAVQLNHTIVAARDKHESATFLSEGTLNARSCSCAPVTRKSSSAHCSGVASLQRLRQLNSSVSTAVAPASRPESAGRFEAAGEAVVQLLELLRDHGCAD